jgi:flagellar basal-body rod modification protein FlgD
MAVTSTTSSTSTSTNSSQSSGLTADAINDVDLSSFLKLMITELQNQDPLNPMDNKDMLAQLSQIRSIGATDKLTKTLDSVLLGQNISSATNLIGADISALSDDSQTVNGIVDRVSIEKGSPKLHVEGSPSLAKSGTDGSVEAGTYSYRVVWQDNQSGKWLGMEFSGKDAITTTGKAGVDQAIQLRNLPASSGPKQIYRTDGTGKEPYQLVETLSDGKQATFTDTKSNAERTTKLTRDFTRVSVGSRTYDVSLNNVAAIRPPAKTAN